MSNIQVLPLAPVDIVVFDLGPISAQIDAHRCPIGIVEPAQRYLVIRDLFDNESPVKGLVIIAELH